MFKVIVDQSFAQRGDACRKSGKAIIDQRAHLGITFGPFPRRSTSSRQLSVNDTTP
jgi:hypothetical protein